MPCPISDIFQEYSINFQFWIVPDVDLCVCLQRGYPKISWLRIYGWENHFPHKKRAENGDPWNFLDKPIWDCWLLPKKDTNFCSFTMKQFVKFVECKWWIDTSFPSFSTHESSVFLTCRHKTATLWWFNVAMGNPRKLPCFIAYGILIYPLAI